MRKTIKVYSRRSEATKALRKLQKNNSSDVFATLYQLWNGWHVAIQADARFDSYKAFLAVANKQFQLTH